MSATTATLRLGVVSYLNTLPLIDGLEGLAELEMRHSVPSRLVDQLVAGDVDVALCSSIDYQRSQVPLRIVPVGMLGCRGATLTVRLFSSVPFASIDEVHCDSDSHTSVALMQVLLRERFGSTPRVVPFDTGTDFGRSPSQHPRAVLLIGDKVVNGSPPAVRYPHQLDLGAAWFEWTGRPFVFATWMARADADPGRVLDLAAILDHQRRHNLHRLDGIVLRRAAEHGWPTDVAGRYLGECLRYDLDAESEAGMALFFEKCRAANLIDRVRPIDRFDAVVAAAPR